MSNSWFKNVKKWVAVSSFGAASLLSVSGSAQTVESKVDYHVVQPGDTLYDLSGAYFGDVYQWPKLWGYNVHITNPHWIYPGDIIYLSPRGEDAPVDPKEGPAPMRGMHLPVAGMVTSELEYVGEIMASPKEANMISPTDPVWFDLKDKDDNILKSKPGDVYAIVRPDGEVEDGEGERLGEKYHVVGTMRVVEQSDDYYDTGVIVQSFREIERGDRLIKYERQIKVLQPIKSDKDMVAQIVDGIDVLFAYGEHHYVFVNRGAEDGLKPGNRFFVYHRSEGLDFNERESEERVPFRKVGQVMVIDVREKFSLAVITDSSKEIEAGDRLEMYKGY